MSILEKLQELRVTTGHFRPYIKECAVRLFDEHLAKFDALTAAMPQADGPDHILVLRDAIAQLQAYRFATPTPGKAIRQWFCPPTEEGMTVISRDATLAVIDAMAVAMPQSDGEAISDAAVVNALASALAVIDGYDPSDQRCGLYDLRWSSGPNPEPLGDAWQMDYLPKANALYIELAAALPHLSAPKIEEDSPSESAKHYADLLEEFMRKMVVIGPMTEPEHVGLIGALAILRRVQSSSAPLPPQGAAVDGEAYWCAVVPDGIVEFGMSCDDANGGEAARTEVNDWINEAIERGEAGNSYRLVKLCATPQPAALGVEPIPMVLHCPKCGVQHVDAPEPHHLDAELLRAGVPATGANWTNPPHRSHLCHACGCIWRPADVATTGVARIRTTGKADNWTAAPVAAPAVDGWIVADSQEKRFRCWTESGPEWTTDRSKAHRSARREDAEALAAGDEDAWRIVPYSAAPQHATPTPMDEAIAAGDGTLHGAIDHWQQRALAAEAKVAAPAQAAGSEDSQTVEWYEARYWESIRDIESRSAASDGDGWKNLSRAVAALKMRAFGPGEIDFYHALQYVHCTFGKNRAAAPASPPAALNEPSGDSGQLAGVADGIATEWRWVDCQGRAMTRWNAGPVPGIRYLTDHKGEMRVETRPAPSAGETP